MCLSADPTRYIKTFTSNVASRTTRVPFSLNVLLDNKALQPPLLIPVSATVGGSNELVMPFTVTVLDGDGECTVVYDVDMGLGHKVAPKYHISLKTMSKCLDR